MVQMQSESLDTEWMLSLIIKINFGDFSDEDWSSKTHTLEFLIFMNLLRLSFSSHNLTWLKVELENSEWLLGSESATFIISVIPFDFLAFKGNEEGHTFWSWYFSPLLVWSNAKSWLSYKFSLCLLFRRDPCLKGAVSILLQVIAEGKGILLIG